MQEVMNAHAHESPVTTDLNYELQDENNTFDEQLNGKSSPRSRMHRRSYMLAIRQESSRG